MKIVKFDLTKEEHKKLVFTDEQLKEMKDRVEKANKAKAPKANG